MSSALERVTITPMTQEEAVAIAGWRYDPPYDFYDWPADEDDLAELLDPVRRGDHYFSVRNPVGELVGYFGFGCKDRIVDIGIGLRPDLTGRGLGLGFLEQGLLFADNRFRPVGFKLSVAEFNERAITVYERAGFVQTRSFQHDTNGARFPFVEMERPA